MRKLKQFSLIVPAAADKPAEENSLPHIFRLAEDGTMLCVKAILGLNLNIFDRIYFTILKKHVDRFSIDTLLGLQLKRLGIQNAEIVILESPTASQPETVYRTIEKKDIKGAIFIKDADISFSTEIFPENGVCVYPLDALELVDPRNKSYVAVDDMQHITNIIEKRIVNNLFSAGGYCFENAETYIKTFKRYKSLKPLYLSHLIYAMLLDGENFRPIDISDYIDFNFC